jgi:DNA-binding NarL/FixJ family response regulator
LEARALVATPPNMDSPALDPPAAPASALTCFLVEDSRVIRENLTATLEEMVGASIVGYAEDEGTAVQWLQRERAACDLMIIDIFLKNGTGLVVLAQAKRLQPSLKLVVLTNYATPDIRQRCQSLGADRVFDKSAEIEELLTYCHTVGHQVQNTQ